MHTLPKVYIIHASDSSQHLGRLKEILYNLKSENRISNFTALSPNHFCDTAKKQIEAHDLVISMRTVQLEFQEKEIEKALFSLKDRNPNILIVEIIVDHVPYKHEFIAFPTDLLPIRNRSRKDMDAVWSGIEQNLKQIFPAASIQKESNWTKNLKYAIPAIIIALIIWWWWPPEASPVAEFSSNKTECETPCTVDFNNTSQNAKIYHWDFGDGRNSTERNPSHAYSQPGNYTVKLIAQKGNQQNEKTMNLKITSPDFKVIDVTAEVLGSNSFLGNCPHKFNFTGEIVVNKAGTVKYTWLRSDDATAPVRTLNFSEPGSQTVSTSWTLGAADKTYNNLWQQVKIIEPSEMLSDKAIFKLICNSEEMVFESPPEQGIDEDFIFAVAEKQPEPEGGVVAFYDYVKKSLDYPSQARRMGIEGKVFVQFVVNTDGTLTDVEAIRGIGAGCDEEAVRVIKSAPPWKPGKVRGKAVRVRMVLPITFHPILAP